MNSTTAQPSQHRTERPPKGSAPTRSRTVRNPTQGAEATKPTAATEAPKRPTTAFPESPH